MKKKTFWNSYFLTTDKRKENHEFVDKMQSTSNNINIKQGELEKNWQKPANKSRFLSIVKKPKER